MREGRSSVRRSCDLAVTAEGKFYYPRIGRKSSHILHVAEMALYRFFFSSTRFRFPTRQRRGLGRNGLAQNNGRERGLRFTGTGKSVRTRPHEKRPQGIGRP